MMKKQNILHRPLTLLAALVPVVALSAAEPVARQIEGYWAADKNFLVDRAIEQAIKAGEEVTPAMIEVVDLTASRLVVSFKDGKAEMLMEQGIATYEILASDDPAGTCIVEFALPNGKCKVVNVTAKEDVMTFAPEEGGAEEMRFLRVTRDEFEKRKADLAKRRAENAPPAEQ